MANNHHTQPEPTTLSNHHPLLPANLALDFLTRDYRPTLILALPESQYGEPIRHRLLFSNAAFEKHPELNSDGLHQMFANMAGSSIRIGPWIVHITIIDSCAEDIAVVTASSFENERARFLGSGATTPGSGDLADGVWGAASLKAGGRLPDDDLQRPRRPSISDIADTSDADLTLEGQCRILAGLVDGGRRRSAVSTKAPGSEHARECGRDTKTAIIKEKDDQDRKRDLVPIVDWRKPSEYDPLHFKNLRGVDWDDTAFGPMSGWSSTLGSIALTMMESPVPIALYWGTLLALYL